MRHTTGNGANGFHLLGMLELSLQFIVIPDISQGNDTALRRAAVIRIHSSTDADGDLISAFGVPDGIDSGKSFPGEYLVNHHAGFRPVFIGDESMHFAPQPFIESPAENFRENRVEIKDTPFHIVNHHRIRVGFQDGAVSLFTVTKCILCQFLFGNIV